MIRVDRSRVAAAANDESMPPGGAEIVTSAPDGTIGCTSASVALPPSWNIVPASPTIGPADPEKRASVAMPVLIQPPARVQVQYVLPIVSGITSMLPSGESPTLPALVKPGPLSRMMPSATVHRNGSAPKLPATTVPSLLTPRPMLYVVSSAVMPPPAVQRNAWRLLDGPA